MAIPERNPTARESYRLGDMTLDVAACHLVHLDQEIPLPRLSFDFLTALVRNAPDVVSLDGLMTEVWRGVVVSDETVTQRAKLLRDALAKVDASTTYVETVRGRGYRLGVTAECVKSGPENRHNASFEPAGIMRWLHNRRIPQVAGVYALAAWMVLQIAEFATPQYPLPEWTFRVLLAAMAVGFPLVIALTLRRHSSASDPDQTRGSWHPGFGVVMALIAVTVVANAWWAAGITSPREIILDQQAPADRLPGIAVLPFRDFSPDGDKAYFSDGIHDELLSRLAATGAFRVPSRTTVERFRDSSPGAIEIAQLLDVEAVLEGSVRHAGERVRVTVQLIDGKSDDHLWAQNYDRKLSVDDLFAMQSDIAIAIARQMEATLSAEQQRSLGDAPTQSLDAYDAYLKGLHHGRRYNASDLKIAVSLFIRATDLDPTFARAWSALANTYAFATTSYGWLAPDQGMKLAKEAGAKALELDSEHATSLSLMGDIKLWYERDFESAESYYLRAIATDPQHTGNRLGYAYLLSAGGRHDEALGQIFQSLEQEQRSARVYTNAAWRFLNARQFQKAIEYATEALVLDSSMRDAHVVRAYAHVFLGSVESALVDARTADISELLGVVLAYAGRREEAQAHIAILSEPADGFAINPVSLAMVHTALGDFDAAFACLEQALAIRHRGVLMLDAQPVFDPLRSDPRYEALYLKVFGKRDSLP